MNGWHKRSGAWVRLGLAVLGLAFVLAACSEEGDRDVAGDPPDDPQPTERATTDPAPSPDGQPVANPDPVPAEPAPSPPAATVEADGTWSGLVVRAEARSLTIDKVDILSGAEAARARAEDGEQPVEGGVDVPYVRNVSPTLRTIPVASDATVRSHDCGDSGCQLVTRTYAEFVGSGASSAGGPKTPFTITIRDGAITEIVEHYFA